MKCPQVCSSPQLPSVSLKRPSPTMALSVLYTLAKVASSRPTPECSLLFGSTPYGPQATPTAEPSTSWSPHATSPSCPYDSVGDSIKICPSKFPTFPPTKEVAPSCEVAVIGALRACDPPPHSHAYHARCCLCARPGAGTGGLYTALRLVDTGTVAASAICIFEMTGRVGGRIMSLRGLGPEENLVVDRRRLPHMARVHAYRPRPHHRLPGAARPLLRPGRCSVCQVQHRDRGGIGPQGWLWDIRRGNDEPPRQRGRALVP